MSNKYNHLWEHYGDAARHITAAFLWANTTEGQGFWQQIHDRLIAHSERARVVGTYDHGNPALVRPLQTFGPLFKDPESYSLYRADAWTISKKLTTVVDIIGNGFTWTHTPEGLDFWSLACQRLGVHIVFLNKRAALDSIPVSTSKDRRLLLDIPTTTAKSENQLPERGPVA